MIQCYYAGKTLENNDKQWIEELNRKVASAKQKAHDDEIKRIEKDVTLQSHALVEKYFSEQDTSLKETLARAGEDRTLALEKLQQRKGDILRVLGVERKKKIEERKRLEEERKRQEELERKRKAEEEKKRREQEERERKEKVRAAIERIRSHHNNGDIELALDELQKAFEIDSNHDDLKVWEKRLTEAQQKKLRDEEAAREREQELARQERKRKNKILRLVAASVIGVVLVFLIYQLQKEIFPPTVFIAVEPFTVSGASLQEPSLGSFLAEEVAGKMSSFPNVTVMDFASSQNIRRSIGSPNHAINKMGYPFILSGSITAKGNSLTADMKAVDSTNTEIWSGHIEHPSSSLKQLTEEIVLQLAKAMDVDLTEDQIRTLRQSGSSMQPAFMLYLKGMSALHKEASSGNREAYGYFTQAFGTDSRYAEAYAGAASALLVRIEKKWDTSDSAKKLAQKYTQEALKSRPELPMANIAQARLLTLGKQYSGAVALLDQVLAKNPDDASALLQYANILLQSGRYDEALVKLNKAYDVSPRDIEILTMLSYALAFKRNFKEAMTYSEYAVSVSEDSTRYLVEVTMDIVMGDPDLQVAYGKRIIAACERILREQPRDLNYLYHYAQILQVMGKIPEANQPLIAMRNMLQNQLIFSPRNAEAMTDLALMQTRFGSFPAGLDMARRAIAINKNNPTILYKIAQMYSVQMASHRGGKIDSGKKAEALKYLREAVALDFQLNELMDGDFYNLQTQPEFLTTIQLQSK